MDRGQLAGTSTAQSAELRAAKARIAELEAELATVKRASELFSKGRVVRPKEIHGLVATLVAEGHGATVRPGCQRLAVGNGHRTRHAGQPPGRAQPPSNNRMRHPECCVPFEV